MNAILKTKKFSVISVLSVAKELNPFRYSSLLLFVLIGILSWFITSSAQAVVRAHPIAPGDTKGATITADDSGDVHQFFVALTKASPVKTKVVRGTPYFQVVEDTHHYYAAGVNWVLPGNLTSHPAWAQNGAVPATGNQLTSRYEVVTQSPHSVQNGLGYLITVKGKRIRVGGTGGGGNGEIIEEDWGSSFTGQAIEGFAPSSEETINNAQKTVLGNGTVSISGIATAGQKVDLSHYPFSYKLTVQKAGDPELTIFTSPTQTQPKIHQALCNWNVDELKGDGSRKYPAGEYVVKLTVTPGNQGGEGGTVTTNVTITDPQVTFSGLARSCAGGVAVDGVHDFTITATAKETGGAPIADTEFKFSFKNNRGHDYTSDSHKPDGWTTAQTKRAKFVTTAGGAQSLVEELTATTNAQGNISVHVLSSDIISTDIKVVAKQMAEHGGRQVGEKACDFGAVDGKRGWRNQYDLNEPYPSGDDGWLINQQWLDTPDEETTAKMYLQFRADYAAGDVETNWKRINGHKLLFEIDHIALIDGGTSSNPEEYATLVDPNNSQNIPPIIETRFDGYVNGAATVLVRAGTRIEDVGTIWLAVHDQSQWAN